MKQILKRFAPSAWLEDGLLVRPHVDSVESKPRRGNSRIVSLGITGVVAVASVVFSMDANDGASFLAVGNRDLISPDAKADHTHNGHDIVESGYWPQVRLYIDSLSFPEQGDDVDLPEPAV